MLSFRISSATGVQAPPGGQKAPHAYRLRSNKGASSFFPLQQGCSLQSSKESEEARKISERGFRDKEVEVLRMRENWMCVYP